MPYGMKGGDTKEKDKWMEGCVSKVKKQGKDEGSAIAICKSTYDKSHGDEKKAEFILNEILASSPMLPNPDDTHRVDAPEDGEDQFMQQCMMKLNKKGMTPKDAQTMCENMWNKSGQNKTKAQIIFHLLEV